VELTVVANRAGTLLEIWDGEVPLRCGRRVVGRYGTASPGGIPVRRDGRFTWRRVVTNPQTGYWAIDRIDGRATGDRGRVTGTYSYEQHLPDGRVCRTGVVRFAASRAAYTGTLEGAGPVAFTLGDPGSWRLEVPVTCADDTRAVWRAQAGGTVRASVEVRHAPATVRGTVSVSDDAGCAGFAAFTAVRRYGADAFGAEALTVGVPGVVVPAAAG
jgi:hypothetical protein